MASSSIVSLASLSSLKDECYLCITRNNGNASFNVGFCDGKTPIRILETCGSYVSKLDAKVCQKHKLLPQVKQMDQNHNTFDA